MIADVVFEMRQDMGPMMRLLWRYLVIFTYFTIDTRPGFRHLGVWDITAFFLFLQSPWRDHQDACLRLECQICLVGYEKGSLLSILLYLFLYSKLLYLFSVQACPGDFTTNATQTLKRCDNNTMHLHANFTSFCFLYGTPFIGASGYPQRPHQWWPFRPSQGSAACPPPGWHQQQRKSWQRPRAPRGTRASGQRFAG